MRLDGKSTSTPSWGGGEGRGDVVDLTGGGDDEQLQRAIMASMGGVDVSSMTEEEQIAMAMSMSQSEHEHSKVSAH